MVEPWHDELSILITHPGVFFSSHKKQKMPWHDELSILTTPGLDPGVFFSSHKKQKMPWSSHGMVNFQYSSPPDLIRGSSSSANKKMTRVPKPYPCCQRKNTRIEPRTR